MNVPPPESCPQFDDQAIAAAATGLLDESDADRLFEHMADCAVCQNHMRNALAETAAVQIPDLPGDDENAATIHSFLAKVRITPPAVSEYSPGDHIERYEVIRRIGKGGS